MNPLIHPIRTTRLLCCRGMRQPPRSRKRRRRRGSAHDFVPPLKTQTPIQNMKTRSISTLLLLLCSAVSLLMTGCASKQDSGATGGLSGIDGSNSYSPLPMNQAARTGRHAANVSERVPLNARIDPDPGPPPRHPANQEGLPTHPTLLDPPNRATVYHRRPPISGHVWTGILPSRTAGCRSHVAGTAGKSLSCGDR